MKILFVTHDLNFADHIAISYLSSIAKESGHSTYFCSIDDTSLPDVVEKEKPDVVGYSVNIVGYRKILDEHRKALKKRNFISIMGGPHPTFSPETFNESGMDAYCVGEGEYAFRDFLECVEKGMSFDNVENLITKNKTNELRPLIRTLDDLPVADRDLVIANSFLKNTAKKTFYTTRGCPFGCAYCCNNYYNKIYRGKGPVVRRFSVERIIREMEYVKNRYRMDFIKIGDDLFATGADEWLIEFVEKYSKRIKTPFNCYLRVDSIDDDLLKLLKKAGCFSVHLSVDSVSRNVRENVLKRRMQSEDFVSKMKKVREYGINTWVNYMLAVPESSLQDDIDTIKLSREADVTYPSYSTTDPMKGTELYEYCIKRKLIDNSYQGDMNGCSKKTILACFSEKEKDVRYNIYLLGAIAAKTPSLFMGVLLFMIKVIPPNKLFILARKYFYNYSIENKIFKIPQGG